jgi:SAM-dependent methyltransferase
MQASAPERVRSRFRDKAREFDDLYEDERTLVKLLRPGLLRRRQLAVDTVRAYGRPRVLDVGCGSGRIGEFVLDAGAADYVGIDFSEPMLGLAHERLERFGERVQLIEGDFHDTPLDGQFDVVLALGLFDYLAEPQRTIARLAEMCAPDGCVVGSFPAWSWIKGPIRKVRYEWIGNCPIFEYTTDQVEAMFAAADLASVEFPAKGRSGFLVRAARPRRGAAAPPGPPASDR